MCGARGAGDAAAQGVFLAMRPHEVYMLVSDWPLAATSYFQAACTLQLVAFTSHHEPRMWQGGATNS